MSSLRSPFRLHAAQIAVTIAAAVLVVLAARADPPPRGTPAADEPPLVAAIRARDGLDVDVLVWAEGAAPDGSLGDALAPRTFVLSARPSGESHHDVYLGHARLGPGGVPLVLSRLFDLTSTADADETGLCAEGPTAAFVTRFNGHATGVTVLHLRGDLRPAREPWLTALKRDVENLVHTGSTAGVAARRYFFDHAVAAAGIALADGGAAVEVRFRTTPDAPEAAVRIDALRGDVSGAGAEHLAARPLAAPDPDLLAWSVNTARDVDWIGTERIELAKQLFFGALDTWKRLTWSDSDDDAGEAPVVGVGAGAGGAGLPPFVPAPGASALDGPPPPVAPVAGLLPHKGEGSWERLAFPAALPGAPPAFWTTTHRPDPERPFAWVRLVAMDPRQLELHMVGGTEHPRSPTGFADTGMVPPEPAVRRRLVAAFSGGFQAIHGAYGMVTERGVLLPPKAGAATVAVARDGTIRFGEWPADPADPAKAAAVPAFLIALRQNLPPLLAGGVVNPTKRRAWGYTVPGEDPVYTWRSALGVTADGRLVFGVGPSLSAETLAVSMKAAGCIWAMHLDMNISNIHFELFRPAGEGPALPAGPGTFRGHVPPRPDHVEDLSDAIMLTTSMWNSGFPRYLGAHERDFFYLTTRAVLPPPPIGPGAGDAAAVLGGAGRWETAGVPAGATAWPPIAARTFVAPDGERPADRVELVLLDAGAAALELAPEDAAVDAAASGTGAPAGARGPVLLALCGRGLGEDTPFGAALGERSRPALAGAATLAVGADGAPRLGRLGAELPPGAVVGDFIQGPSLVEAGKLLESYARWWAPRPRWGLGVTVEGRFVLAFGFVASDRTIAEALLLAGAVTAIDLSAGGGPELAVTAPGAPDGATAALDWIPAWARPGAAAAAAGTPDALAIPLERAGLRAVIRFRAAAPRPPVTVGKILE